MARDGDRPWLLRVFELAVAALLTREVPAVLMQLAQEDADFHRGLADGGGGKAGFATVGGFEEVEA
jgi:hypothetical protein